MNKIQFVVQPSIVAVARWQIAYFQLEIASEIVIHYLPLCDSNMN